MIDDIRGHARAAPGTTRHPFRFGVVSENLGPAAGWLDQARRIEDAGVDVLLVRDHFTPGSFGPQPAPFSYLAAVATVTTRLHVGTMVLSNDYRHPVLVAHEAGTLHAMSGGRFELGLGAGWDEPEYRAAGLPFAAARTRIDRLEQSLTLIRALFDGKKIDDPDGPYPVAGLDLSVLPGLRGRPHILVGAGGRRMLALAARHADIVGILPAPIRNSADSDAAADRLPAAFESKLGVLREAGGARYPDLELSSFVTLRVSDRRRAATEELIAERGWTGLDPETVWTMPTVLIGSADQIRQDLYARRERFGLSYFVTGDANLPALAEVIAGL